MTADQTNITPTCVNHPGVETRLTCSSCGNPICPRCMVTTAVGQKCGDCARQPRAAKGAPPPVLVARAFGAGFVVAAVGGAVLLFVPFLGLILAAVLGFAVSATVRWAARRRVHNQLGLAAGAAAVLGILTTALLLGAVVLHPRLLLAYLVAGGVAFARASGRW
ncbi:MAG TPA: hypothetical protein VF486_02255 [Actinomycetes bacterium]